MLHEKELVLNKQDTENILQSVNLVRQISDWISGRVNAMQYGSMLSAFGLPGDNKNVLDLANGAINGNTEDLKIMSAIIEQIDVDVLNHVSNEVKNSMLALKQSAANYYEEVFTMNPTAKGDIPVYIGSIEFKEKFDIDLDSFEGQLQLVQTITRLADDMVTKFNEESKAAANSELPYNKNDRLD